MAEAQTPEIWAGVATQYVGAWGQAAPWSKSPPSLRRW